MFFALLKCKKSIKKLETGTRYIANKYFICHMFLFFSDLSCLLCKGVFYAKKYISVYVGNFFFPIYIQNFTWLCLNYINKFGKQMFADNRNVCNLTKYISLDYYQPLANWTAFQWNMSKNVGTSRLKGKISSNVDFC